MTRLGLRLDPGLCEAFGIAGSQALVGTEFPVTWGEHEAQGKVVQVEADDKGVVVTMEVSSPLEADSPGWLAY